MNWDDAGWAYWNEERIESTEPDAPPFDNYERFAGIWIARAKKVVAVAVSDRVMYEIHTAVDIGQHEANDQIVEWLKQIGVLVQVYPEPTTNSDLIDIGLVDEVEK